MNLYVPLCSMHCTSEVDCKNNKLHSTRNIPRGSHTVTAPVAHTPATHPPPRPSPTLAPPTTPAPPPPPKPSPPPRPPSCTPFASRWRPPLTVTRARHQLRHHAADVGEQVFMERHRRHRPHARRVGVPPDGGRHDADALRARRHRLAQHVVGAHRRDAVGEEDEDAVDVRPRVRPEVLVARHRQRGGDVRPAAGVRDIAKGLDDVLLAPVGVQREPTHGALREWPRKCGRARQSQWVRSIVMASSLRR